MPPALTILLATGLAFFAFISGGVISHKFSHFLARHSSKVLAFASGAMLSITFGHVLPEAVEISGGSAWLAIFAGVVFFFVIEHFFYLHGCPDHESHHECKNHALGPLSAIGIGIHSFFDGVLIVFSFLANPILGWFAALGIMLHKLPAGAILHSIICHNHADSKKSLWWIFAVALTTPLAVILVPFADKLSNELVGVGLAFSAGTLLYITLSDLLPETHQTKNKFNLVFLALGIAMIFGLNTLFEAHTHEDEIGHSSEIHLESPS
jgi:zinc transporter ZupT